MKIKEEMKKIMISLPLITLFLTLFLSQFMVGGDDLYPKAIYFGNYQENEKLPSKVMLELKIIEAKNLAKEILPTLEKLTQANRETIRTSQEASIWIEKNYLLHANVFSCLEQHSDFSYISFSPIKDDCIGGEREMEKLLKEGKMDQVGAKCSFALNWSFDGTFRYVQIVDPLYEQVKTCAPLNDSKIDKCIVLPYKLQNGNYMIELQVGKILLFNEEGILSIGYSPFVKPKWEDLLDGTCWYAFKLDVGKKGSTLIYQIKLNEK